MSPSYDICCCHKPCLYATQAGTVFDPKPNFDTDELLGEET
jgi:hypothetical protein